MLYHSKWLHILKCKTYFSSCPFTNYIKVKAKKISNNSNFDLFPTFLVVVHSKLNPYFSEQPSPPMQHKESRKPKFFKKFKVIKSWKYPCICTKLIFLLLRGENHNSTPKSRIRYKYDVL